MKTLSTIAAMLLLATCIPANCPAATAVVYSAPDSRGQI